MKQLAELFGLVFVSLQHVFSADLVVARERYS